ncbi:MAG: 4Fe-4S dicluster domain-containing protein [Deltaproteobacteria bacterium]|nr:4Fe-4S dicluster domain-containing protein [Deltaproteobacteria bacterium]
MKVLTIDKKEWAAGIERTKSSYQVFGPVKEKEWHCFKALGKDEQPDMTYTNTRLSPKFLVQPQTEPMFTYTLDENQPDHHILKEVNKDLNQKAVVGIRPCDASAFLLVKRNFDAPQYQDPYWLKAYSAMTFVGFACNDPCSTCFCTSAGCGPFHEAGLDVLLVDAGDRFLAKSLTDKGNAFLAAAGWSASADDAGKIETLRQAAESKIGSHVSTENLKTKETTQVYDAPFWEDTAFSCINCGTCTYSCPTCWCFDIQDENRGTSGVRLRNWDSCMFPLFTIHGTGHNPRGAKVQRVRQRFMHKLKYYVDKYDNGIQCVGCGRCVRLCPVNIDIRKVCNQMNDYDPAACVCPA